MFDPHNAECVVLVTQDDYY